MFKIRALGLALAFFVGMTGAAMAAGDADKGAKIFKKCKACHTLEEGGTGVRRTDGVELQPIRPNDCFPRFLWRVHQPAWAAAPITV